MWSRTAPSTSGVQTRAFRASAPPPVFGILVRAASLPGVGTPSVTRSRKKPSAKERSQPTRVQPPPLELSQPFLIFGQRLHCAETANAAAAPSKTAPQGREWLLGWMIDRRPGRVQTVILKAAPACAPVGPAGGGRAVHCRSLPQHSPALRDLDAATRAGAVGGGTGR